MSYLTENWLNCAGLTGNSAGLRTVISSLFHTENCAVHSGDPTVSSVYLPTPRWHHLTVHPFLAIHSADGHRMIYSFSNTTSYSTFYALFSSFRITLCPMWLANSKDSLFLSTIFTHTRRHPELTIKLKNVMGNLCCDREHSFSFSCSFFYTVKLHILT